VAQAVDPKFKPQYHNNNNNNLKKPKLSQELAELFRSGPSVLE
jgi:hypothetical protein